MTATVPAALATHLDGELTTLCTLWQIIRRDGVEHYYTDHDEPITFEGNLYKTGVGYDRSAVEDKSDMSPDNMDVKGILGTGDITREDIRAGLFDGAEVWIRIINWDSPSDGALIRRRGWFGEVKQNNLGQFDTELRGLAEALSEEFNRSYTPGCVADLGTTLADEPYKPCGRKLIPDFWAEDTEYEAGQEVRIPGVTDLIFRAQNDGRTSPLSAFDEYAFDVYENDIVSDGTINWLAAAPWHTTATVKAVPAPNRRDFYVQMNDLRKLTDDARYFDGGLAVFSSGDNNAISGEIKYVNEDSDGEVYVFLYLRMPYNVSAGDTLTLYPGCDKSTTQCKTKFFNLINFKGFPDVPGDDYLKQYPDRK